MELKRGGLVRRYKYVYASKWLTEIIGQERSYKEKSIMRKVRGSRSNFGGMLLLNDQLKWHAKGGRNRGQSSIQKEN